MNRRRLIYLDAHSTTPVDPEVLEAMLPYFTERFGNPASRNHAFGCEAGQAVEKSRAQIADLIGAGPEEIIFTSSATESNNLAIKGMAQAYAEKGNHLITQVTEHKSVLETCKELEKKGWKVTFLPVDSTGKIDLSRLEQALTEKTVLISVMAANHEIGTIQPIAEIGKLAKAHGVLFHVDAAQAAGKIPLDVRKMGIDLASFSAHKMYGPKGIAALYVRRRNPHVRLLALFQGGGQEKGLRSGTLNVPGIVGFGKACEIAKKRMPEESRSLTLLRDRLKSRLEEALDEISLNGHPTDRLPQNLNMSFSWVEGPSLLMGLNEEIAVSSSSACSTASSEPSYVLKALGLRPYSPSLRLDSLRPFGSKDPEGFSNDRAYTSIRFGIGRFNTLKEIDYAADRVISTVKKLRSLSPLYAEIRKPEGVKTRGGLTPNFGVRPLRNRGG